MHDGCASWRRAAAILDDLGHPDGEAVRRQLQLLTAAAASPGVASSSFVVD